MVNTYSVIVLESGKVVPTITKGLTPRAAWEIVNGLADAIYSDKAHQDYEAGYRIFLRNHNTMGLTSHVDGGIYFSVTDSECFCVCSGFILKDGVEMPKNCRYYDASVGHFVSGDIVECAIAHSNSRA